jgi:hypothetical protein
MTSGFGVDASANGTSGTSSQDIRRILAAQYTEGVLKGCDVTTSASAMTYTVSAGVVAIKISVDEIVLAPVDQATVTAAAAPVTGSRIDKVYVKQRFPGIPAEADANIVVGVTSGALPANSLELRRYTVSAGTSNTNAAVASSFKIYSLPTSGSLGLLHYWQNTYTGSLSVNTIREGHGTFTLATDRRLTFKVRAILNAVGAVGWDNSKYCEWGFLFNIDNADFVLHSTPGLHQAWATYEFTSSIEVAAGTHTVNLGSRRQSGPGVAETRYGLDGAGFGRRGIEFSVIDDGPIQTSFDVSPNF